MSNVRSQGCLNSEVPEVSSHYVPFLDDIAMYIKQVRESNPPLFSTMVCSVFVEDWTRVKSHNFNALSIPKSIKVKIAYVFFRGEPAVWFKRATQPRIYRWNKFRSSLERNFGSIGADWERRMVKNLEITQMILVRVVLADVRMQAHRINDKTIFSFRGG